LRAHLEITGGALRLYHDDAALDRDPPDFFVAVVGHEGLAIIKGMVTGPSQSLPLGMWPAVRAELRRVGFTEVLWTRYDAKGVQKRIVRKKI
jgi:hypothetical protein